MLMFMGSLRIVAFKVFNSAAASHHREAECLSFLVYFVALALYVLNNCKRKFFPLYFVLEFATYTSPSLSLG